MRHVKGGGQHLLNREVPGKRSERDRSGGTLDHCRSKNKDIRVCRREILLKRETKEKRRRYPGRFLRMKLQCEGVKQWLENSNGKGGPGV